MATETLSAITTLTPYSAPPGLDRTNTALPFGLLTHLGSVATSAHASGDLIQLNCDLPTGYAYKLKSLMLSQRPNSGSNAFNDGELRIDYTPAMVPTTDNVTRLTYPLVNSKTNYNDTRHFFLGLTGNASPNTDMMSPGMSNPSMPILAVPAGVSAWIPAVRLQASAVGAAGNLTYCLEWNAFDVEQKNSVAMNQNFPVTF